MPPTDRLQLIPRAPDIPALLALTTAYTLSAVLGLQWSVAPGAGPAVWLPTGLALAALLLYGPQLWPAAVAGRILAALAMASPQPWWAIAVLGVTAGISALLPVWLLRRTGPLDMRLAKLSDIVRLTTFGALGTLAPTPLGMSALWASGTPLGQLSILVLTGTLASTVGIMVVTPAILTWSGRSQRRLSTLSWGHLAICLGAVALVSELIFLSPRFQPFRTWHLFPVLVWAALAFSVRGASLALIVTFAFATAGAVLNLGPLSELAGSATDRLLVAQQFMAASGVTILVLAAVADERRAKERLETSEALLRAETEALETLNATGAMIAAEIELEPLVQSVTDVGVALTGAQFGAFFYNVIREDGGAYTLFTLSGAPRSAFETFGMPRDTPIFHPTFAGEGIVRSADITRDPRYGTMAPHHGMPQGHLPVRSYLAAPVRSRSGEVLGGLFFGHSEVGVFDARAERVVAGIAAQAALGIDKAKLYAEAQREIAQRTRAEEHQRLLINELNHRVKNTLATVQSIAAQTARTAGGDPAKSYEGFVDRLLALSRAHDVLTRQNWEGAQLAEVVEGAIRPFGGAGAERFQLSGPAVWLEPGTALALAMALHELGTNASKYGALSTAKGGVTLTWQVRVASDGPRLEVTWTEHDGPKVAAPKRKGFGSRLLERGLPGDLGGEVSLDYRPGGLVCRMEARLDRGAAAGKATAAAPA